MNGVGTRACAIPAEAVVVTKASPALTTTASGSVAAGGQVSDVAHLTLGTNPTGTISFPLFRADGATRPVITGSATASAHGRQPSGPLPLPQTGTITLRAAPPGGG